MRAATVTPISDPRAATAEPAPERGSSWRTVLLSALVYAGAPFDPAIALAAQRFERIRERERRNGTW